VVQQTMNHGESLKRLFNKAGESRVDTFGMRNTPTCAPVVRLESVFLKDKLIINSLDLWEVEVGLGYQNGGL
jgi:hypothetical protein